MESYLLKYNKLCDRLKNNCSKLESHAKQGTKKWDQTNLNFVLFSKRLANQLTITWFSCKSSKKPLKKNNWRYFYTRNPLQIWMEAASIVTGLWTTSMKVETYKIYSKFPPKKKKFYCLDCLSWSNWKLWLNTQSFTWQLFLHLEMNFGWEDTKLHQELFQLFLDQQYPKFLIMKSHMKN